MGEKHSMRFVQVFQKDFQQQRALLGEGPPSGEEGSDVPAEDKASLEGVESIGMGEGPAPSEPLSFAEASPHVSEARGSVDDEWANLERCFQEGAPLQARVAGCNKGGLLVSLSHLQGFVPASQLLHFPRYLDSSGREAYLAEQQGKELRLKIIELDRERNHLVLSERACVWTQGNGEGLWETLKSGEVRDGIVSNLCDFGAFVDLGGIDGLLHVSEISWRRVGHPHEVLNIGDHVRVRILSVNQEQKRISLSLKRAQADPWATLEERYQVGQVVRGVITNVVDFGAFARIEDGVEGLIHISELAEGSFLHPRNVVKEGDEVNLRILRVDGPNHRLGLSLRQAR